jgi:hypothetical protein
MVASSSRIYYRGDNISLTKSERRRSYFPSTRSGKRIRSRLIPKIRRGYRISKNHLCRCLSHSTSIELRWSIQNSFGSGGAMPTSSCFLCNH